MLLRPDQPPTEVPAAPLVSAIPTTLPTQQELAEHYGGWLLEEADPEYWADINKQIQYLAWKYTSRYARETNSKTIAEAVVEAKPIETKTVHVALLSIEVQHSDVPLTALDIIDFYAEWGTSWLLAVNQVQAFLNQKVADGYAFDTLKSLKWGLSAVFSAAVKYKYIKSNPVRSADLPPEGIREEATLPSASELELLIANLPEPLATAVWLVAVTCIRPEELAFKWSDLDAGKRQLWIIRAVNRGKFHTPKYHRSNRPIQLTEEDVERLLAMKERMKAGDDDWMFPHSRKTGPMVHEQIMGRVVQPVARKLGLPHNTWRLLRHWGTTQMVESHVPIKAAQQRLGHSRPDILLKHYTHVLDESAEFAATTLSSKLSEKVHKKADSKTDIRSIGSQTAANKKKWVM